MHQRNGSNPLKHDYDTVWTEDPNRVVVAPDAEEDGESKIVARPTQSRTKATLVPRMVKAALALLDEFLDRPTEGGFAEWFLVKCGDDIRYISEYGKWALWDGRRWLVDGADAINERAKGALHAIILMIARVDSQDKQNKMLRLAHRFDSTVRIRQMLEYAATDERVITSIRDYDRDEWLLNLANGTLDLRDGRLLAHQKSQMLTKVLDIQYEPYAKAPTFEAFLERIFRSHPEIIPFLQRAVGYTLTASVREHKFWLLYGSGRNGKSTLVETIRTMLGEYAQSSTAETWLKQSGSRGAEPELACLVGVRMAATAEIGEGRALDEARVKGIVAGDAIRTRNLYESTIEFTPACKLWISTNHRPQIKSTDEGMWRRVCLIPFDETIGWDEMDRDLPTKLLEEQAGILAWAVNGCLEWQRRGGLDLPDIVVARTSEYRDSEDTVGQFIDECCVLGNGERVLAGALFRAYTDWAHLQGDRRPLNATLFGRRLSERGIAAQKPGGVAWRSGIDLRPSENQDSRYEHD
jgi:putative DNA primase/helicase